LTKRAKTTAVKIRKGTPLDFQDIVRSFWSDPEVPWEPYANVRMLREFVGPKGFIIAEVGGSFAGFLHYFVGTNPWFDPEVKRYGQILELHVLPEYQNLEVGTKLMRAALSKLEKYPMVYVHTDEKNIPARRLYGKMGFRPFIKTFYMRKTRGPG
jgi:ribosomal protein S18 acetylase RimI-like enzyme